MSADEILLELGCVQSAIAEELNTEKTPITSEEVRLEIRKAIDDAVGVVLDFLNHSNKMAMAWPQIITEGLQDARQNASEWLLRYRTKEQILERLYPKT